MKTKLFHIRTLIVLSLIAILTAQTNAQIISSEVLTEIHLCQRGTFQTTIYNSESYTLTGNLITIKFPCDLQYIEGSTIGATESDIDDLSEVIFEIPDIEIDSSHVISFDVIAPCSVLDCINSATIFYNEIGYTHDNGTINTTTDPYNIETAQLIITKVEDPVIDGFKGAELTRKIYLRNTRLGKLSSFLYRNVSDEGITVSSDMGTDISELQGELLLEFGSSDFIQIGDGDEWFEFNEEIVIVENILVETCAYDLLTAVSNIEISWGCEDEVCETSLQNSVVDINVNYEFGPILSFNQILIEPICYCSIEPTIQGIDITNTGSFTDAIDVYLTINQIPELSGIPNNSINVTINGNAIDIYRNFKNQRSLECLQSNNIYGIANIVIPRISPGEIAKVRWGNIFCNQESCGNYPNSWEYQYHYYKDCALPEDSYYQSKEPIHIQENYDLLFLKLIEAQTFELGSEIQEVKIKINSPIFDRPNGLLNVDLAIPCGMQIVDNEWRFGGTEPLSYSETIVNKIKNIELSYELPLVSPNSNILEFPAYFLDDNNCFSFTFPPKDTIITSCIPDSICQRPPPTNPDPSRFKIDAKASFDFGSECQEVCKIKSCDSRVYYFEYPTSGFIFDTIPGYLDHNFSVYRSSLGLPDNDDNNFPDDQGTLDLSKIRLDRAVTYDTITFDVKGIIKADKTNVQFKNLYIEFKFSLEDFSIPSSTFWREYQRFFESQSGFENVGSKFEIQKATSSSYYSLSNIPHFKNPEIDFEDTTYIISYDLSIDTLNKLNQVLPRDILYEKGDSINLHLTFIPSHNLQAGPFQNEFESFNFKIKSKSLLLNITPVNLDTGFSCNCKTEVIQVGNYFLGAGQSSSDGSSIRTCYNRLYLWNNFRYGTKRNFFPFEAKSPIKFEELYIPKLQNLEFDKVNILYFISNGQFIPINSDAKVYLDSTIVISESSSSGDLIGYYKINLEGIDYLPKGEETDIRIVSQHLSQDCVWPRRESFESEYHYLLDNKGSKSILKDNTSFPGEWPRLDLNILECNKIAFSNILIWEIELSNLGSSFSLYRARNPWLRVITPPYISDFQIINNQTGEIVEQINGIFQLSNVIEESERLSFKVTALNTSCTKEEVIFRYGWNCDPYTDPLETPCEEFEEVCTAISPPGIIEMLPEQIDIEAPLCDTMPYSEVQVFDAGLGSVYQLDLQAYLPRGLSIVPGTTQVAWPAESEAYFSIDDPDEEIPGVYEWRLTDQFDTLSIYGLPGVNSVPNNTISLRFKTTSDCDFISGTNIVYEINAEKICGEPTNSVAKVSEDLNITGISAPYEVVINANTSGESACEDKREISIDVIYLSASDSESHLVAQLPAGLEYVGGTCMSSLQTCEPNINGQFLEWLIPANETTFELSFEISGFEDLPCKTLLIPIYSTADINALCIENNEVCTIQVVTGKKNMIVSLERPVYAFENFIALPVNGSTNTTNLQIDIVNNGIKNVEDIQLDLYLDHDGNGSLSIGDQFIESNLFNEILDTGESIMLQINGLEINPEDLCKLMVVTNSDNSCICSDASRRISTPILFPEVEHFNICSGETLEIGRPYQEGIDYQWQNAELLSCTDCSMSLFQATNESFDPQTYSLILEQLSAEGCQLSFEYLVTVHNEPRIWSADELICQGEQAVLIASEAESYQWQGESITNPSEQIQVIFPSSSNWYFVDIVDQYGCEGRDSVFVNVAESPIANAGEDLSVCYGMDVNLQAYEAEGYSYLWSPGFPFLDDPTSPNPTVLIEEEMSFELTVSKNNCFASDEVQVRFYDGFELQISQDTVICLGDTVSLFVNGGTSYQWLPLYTDMCQSSLCDEIRIAPVETTEFVVISRNAQGCLDTATVHIEIIEDQIYNQSEAYICSGASIEIFGEVQTEPGLYCDTKTFESGCQYINCVQLFVEDKIQTEETAAICRGETYLFGQEALGQAGIYCLDLITNEGCDSIHCLELEVYDLPIFDINPSQASIQVGESIGLNVPDNYESYSWSPAEGLSCTICPDPVAGPLESIIYSIIVTDENGCTTQDSIEVSVVGACNIDELLIPNAFTPDNNSKNDRFRIVNLNDHMNNVSISIYNRWGQKVYSAEGNEGWDGTFKGEDAAPDVYLYVIIISCENQEDQIVKGDVTLIR